MSLEAIADAVWYGRGPLSGMARGALRPASWLYSQIVQRRNARYDARLARATAIPALSVGNLTVGGTGKTPVAAWCVQQLRAKGARPAIVLRGVGDDEWRVHGVLNRGIPVVVSPDRVNGSFVAKTKGADVVVFDDAFQHRQADRIADIVLLSADRWTGSVRSLPAGPFREPLSSLVRAHAIVVTNKAAAPERIDAACEEAARCAPGVPQVMMQLVPGPLLLAAMLLRADGPGVATSGPTISHPPSWLAGRSVSVASAIGDPGAFETQLSALGAAITHRHRFADHHKFSTHEVVHIARRAEGTDGVVCTLKDAVKLVALWPREAPPLWYLSQSVVVSRGADIMDRLFTKVLTARVATSPTAG